MKNNKKKNFIKKHEYPGGKTALSKFIRENLIYPKDAIQHHIEGAVLVAYDLDFDGKVKDGKVLHGIGFGCDEEAIRIVKLLVFAPQNNHGIKIATSHKIKINFKLPKKTSTTIQYQITTSKDDTKKLQEPIQQKKNYSYSIKWN